MENYLNKMPRSTKNFFYIFIGVALLARLICGFFLLPIYPDEIARLWWVQSDENYFKNIMYVCNNGSDFFSYSIFSNLKKIINFVEMFFFTPRFIALFYYAIFIIIATLSATKYDLERKNLHLLVIFISLLFPFNFTFILLRPEANIFYMLYFYSLNLAVCQKNKDFSNIVKFLSYYNFLVAAFTHPKTIYFSIIYLSRFNLKKIITYFWLMIYVAVAFFIYKYWSYRMSCVNPDILKSLNSYNINPIDYAYNISNYFKEVFNYNLCINSNIQSCRWSRFFDNSYFTFDSDIKVFDSGRKIIFPALLYKLILFSFILFFGYRIFSGELYKKRQGVFLILLLVANTFHLIHNKTENFYDLSFWLLVYFFLFLNYIKIQINHKVIVLILIISLFFDSYYFYNSYIHGYEGPGLSLKHYKRVNDKLSDVFTKNQFSKKKILLVDDSTFLFFDGHNKFPITYYSINNDFNALLKTNNFAIVSRCIFFIENKLPMPNVKVYRLKNDEICFLEN